MRRAWVWLALAGVGGLAIVWTMAHLLATPLALPGAPTAGSPVAAAVAATQNPKTPYWQDPSIPPEVLKRAFQPPPADLPPEARPGSFNITPSPKTAQSLRDQELVVY